MNFLEWLGISNASKPLNVGDTAPDVLARVEAHGDLFAPLVR